MNRQRKAAFVVMGIVLLGALVSAALFVMVGSQIGVLAFIIGVPAVLIAGAVFYVQTTVGTSNTTSDQITENQAREAAREFQDLGRDFVRFRENFPEFEGGDIQQRMNKIIERLEDMGVNFDPNTNSYHIKDIQAGYEEVANLRSDIETLTNDLHADLYTFATEEIDRLTTLTSDLLEADLVDVDQTETLELPDQDEVSLGQISETLSRQRSLTGDAIETAIETLRQTVNEESPADTDPIEDELSTALSNLDADQYAAAVSSVLSARRKVNAQLETSFDQTRDSVITLADAIIASELITYRPREEKQQVETLRESASQLDSAMDYDELQRIENDLRTVATDMIEDFQADIQNSHQRLEDTSLPSDWYTKPAAVDNDYVISLTSISDLEYFIDRWEDAVEELLAADEKVDTKNSVVGAYDDIAERIEADLEASGRITGDDLPVKQPREFMDLYQRRNEDVTYDPTEPVLSDNTAASGTAETAAEGDDAVSGDGTQSEDGWPETDSVDRDTPTSDDLLDRNLRDRLCEDFSDVDQYVDEFADDLESRFESERGVTSEMSFSGVLDDFLPCLLAAWGDRNDLSMTQTDDVDIIVYDRDQEINEIENVIRFNLSPGESMTYERIRSDFLSVPLPNRIIKTLGSEISTDAAVTATESGIEKGEEGE